MKPTQPRKVRIVPIEKNGKLISYFVQYVIRRKGQYYNAAQFDASVGREHVERWIAENPKIALQQFLVTWIFADGFESTFTYEDKDAALWKYEQGKMGAREIRKRFIPVTKVRVQEL